MSSEKSQAMVIKPVEKLKGALALESVQAQFKNAMGEASSLFVASIIDAYGSSKGLQECAPAAVIQEALKAAVLRLPIARGLGMAYIVPRAGVPQMQIGWKGWVQLAQRSGQYKIINVDCVYEGEKVEVDRMTGAISITGEATSDSAIGFFAYLQLHNGYSKGLYWSAAKMTAHRDRYVPQWNKAGSAWVTHQREMAQKTILSALLRKWGVLSVEMQSAMQHEQEIETGDPVNFAPNSEPIDVQDVTPDPSKPTPEEQAEAEAQQTDIPAPGF